jgi:hypothetical protein
MSENVFIAKNHNNTGYTFTFIEEHNGREVEETYGVTLAGFTLNMQYRLGYKQPLPFLEITGHYQHENAYSPSDKDKLVSLGYGFRESKAVPIRYLFAGALHSQQAQNKVDEYIGNLEMISTDALREMVHKNRYANNGKLLKTPYPMSSDDAVAFIRKEIDRHGLYIPAKMYQRVKMLEEFQSSLREKGIYPQHLPDSYNISDVSEAAEKSRALKQSPATEIRLQDMQKIAKQFKLRLVSKDPDIQDLLQNKKLDPKAFESLQPGAIEGFTKETENLQTTITRLLRNHVIMTDETRQLPEVKKAVQKISTSIQALENLTEFNPFRTKTPGSASDQALEDHASAKKKKGRVK